MATALEQLKQCIGGIKLSSSLDLLRQGTMEMPDILGIKPMLEPLAEKYGLKKWDNSAVNNLFESLKNLGQGIAGGVASLTEKITTPITKFPGGYVSESLQKKGVSPLLAIGAGITADIIFPGGGK